MKETLVTLICIFILVLGRSQSLYDRSLKDIDGNTLDLNFYKGKKIMFIIISVDARDSLKYSLIAFKERQGDRIEVIGIPAFDLGYTDTLRSSVKAMYSNCGIRLTEGMKVHKSTTGESRNPLISWLTERAQNNHFTVRVPEKQRKFFVNSSGQLFATMPPQVKLNSSVVDQLALVGRMSD